QKSVWKITGAVAKPLLLSGDGLKKMKYIAVSMTGHDGSNYTFTSGSGAGTADTVRCNRVSR
ncbi:MAG: hypothetical protein ABI813_00480, partial [Bacteroidota bacterium]